MPQYVIGVDYGTLSGRAVVVRVDDGSLGRLAYGRSAVMGKT